MLGKIMKKKVFKISFMIHVRVKEHKIIVKLKVKCVMSKKKLEVETLWDTKEVKTLYS